MAEWKGADAAPGPYADKEDTVRTPQDIVEFYRANEQGDFFGFMLEVFATYLTAEQIREFCREDADLAEWPEPNPLTRDAVLNEMREYMSFAWDKAKRHRGISAERSVQRMGAWLWLLGDDEMVAFTKSSENYPQYGAPILKAICEKYGFAIPDDEGLMRMTQGLPCREDCDEGCE